MKLTLVNIREKGNNAGSKAILTHSLGGRQPEQELSWCVKAFDRNRQKVNNLGYEEAEEVVDPFDQLNAYWASLPLDAQDQIYLVYQEIYEVFETSSRLQTLMGNLSPLLQKLYSLHRTANLYYWVKMKSNIRVPTEARVYDTLAENVEKGEQYGSREWPRESTYLKDDYWGLIVLMLALRTLYPIWGRFMGQVKDDVGSELKEFYALKLLTRTDIVKEPEYIAVEKYVKHFVPIDKIKNATVAGYVPVEDFITWMTGLVVVRRLSLLNFTGKNQQFSLVSSIWSFINMTMKQYEKTVNETIKDKNPEGGARDRDKNNKASGLELIKIKESITSGDIVALNEFAENTIQVAKLKCPAVPPAFVLTCIEIANKMQHSIIDPAQITLLQWVIASVVPPRSIPRLDKKAVLSLIAVSLATLWHYKHYDLAALLTAQVMESNDEMSMGGIDTRNRIDKENQEKLLKLYPHVPRGSSRTRVDDFAPADKNNCVANISINLLEKALSKKAWILTLPKSWISLLPNHRTGRHYSVPPDIKNKLAELTIAIATKEL